MSSLARHFLHPPIQLIQFYSKFRFRILEILRYFGFVVVLSYEKKEGGGREEDGKSHLDVAYSDSKY